MNLLKKCGLMSLLLLALATNGIYPAEAARGVPGSPEFGFGVTVYPNGPQVVEALSLATSLHPDWLYVPVSWANSQPASADQPDLTNLDKVMSVVAGQNVSVALSITQAPDWAQTDVGPDPEKAAQFSAILVNRYPGAIGALELFPRANTLTAWGRVPNPKAYLDLFVAVQNRLKADGANVLLIAAGLQPLTGQTTNPAEAMDDISYLQGLYNAGGRDSIQVISMQFADVNTDLLASPSETTTPVFRQYEALRECMLANAHASGMIWITGFGLPSGTFGQNNVDPANLEQQKNWLEAATYQVHAQLYIGVASLQSLNAPADATAGQTTSMLQPDQSLHPFYAVLQQIVQESNSTTETTEDRPGRAKMGNLRKNRL